MEKLDLLQTLLLCDRLGHSTIKRPEIVTLLNTSKRVAKRIIAFGGKLSTGEASTRIYEYDINNNTWYELMYPIDASPALPMRDWRFVISTSSSPGEIVFYSAHSRNETPLFGVLDARNGIYITKQSDEVTRYMSRYHSTLVALSDNLVLSLGGFTIDNKRTRDHASHVLFNRSTGECKLLRPPHNLTSDTACIALTSDTVLITGGAKLFARGTDSSTTTAECMIYHVSTNRITPVASMNSTRRLHALCWLSDGRIFAYGGHHEDKVKYAPEVYDPVEDAWTVLPVILKREAVDVIYDPWPLRFHFACAQLPNGKVFITTDDHRKFPLLYDLETGVLEKAAEVPVGGVSGYTMVPIYE